ncbi:MAG: hypothetical protein JWL83_435 [Actinomycetia bacterium]|nr:hypothetical protein [Actinomycetes bacterium]
MVVLDTAIPTRRFGRALRTARRQTGLRRRAAAVRLGVTPRLLVAWERGTLRVPDDMTGALVDLYGEYLTALVPKRDPARVELGTLVLGEKFRVQASTAADDVLNTYVRLLRAVREAKPGDELPLRTNDLEALAAALDENAADIEARIVEVVHCTREEAAALHNELISRRILVPAASVALGVAAVAGIVVHNQGNTATPKPLRTEVVMMQTPATTVVPVTPATATNAPATTSTPPVTTAPAPPVSAPAPPTTTTPPTVAPTTTPPATPAAATTPTTDDPPVSIPPGENPTIIQP